MSILDNFTLVEFSPQKNRNSLLKRRESICEKLSEQISLAKDPNYRALNYKWVTGVDGEVKKSKVYKKIKPWWYEDDNGNLILSIQYRGRPIDLTPEYNGILFASSKQLVDALVKIKIEFEKGKLDQLLALPPKKKK